MNEKPYPPHQEHRYEAAPRLSSPAPRPSREESRPEFTPLPANRGGYAGEHEIRGEGERAPGGRSARPPITYEKSLKDQGKSQPAAKNGGPGEGQRGEEFKSPRSIYENPLKARGGAAQEPSESPVVSVTRRGANGETRTETISPDNPLKVSPGQTVNLDVSAKAGSRGANAHSDTDVTVTNANGANGNVITITGASNAVSITKGGKNDGAQSPTSATPANTSGTTQTPSTQTTTLAEGEEATINVGVTTQAGKGNNMARASSSGQYTVRNVNGVAVITGSETATAKAKTAGGSGRSVENGRPDSVYERPLGEQGKTKNAALGEGQRGAEAKSPPSIYENPLRFQGAHPQGQNADRGNKENQGSTSLYENPLGGGTASPVYQGQGPFQTPQPPAHGGQAVCPADWHSIRQIGAVLDAAFTQKAFVASEDKKSFVVDPGIPSVMLHDGCSVPTDQIVTKLSHMPQEFHVGQNQNGQTEVERLSGPSR